MVMEDFAGLPVHAQNALKRAGITSVERARALGREAVSKVPGLGPLALARLFPSGEQRRRPEALSPEDLRRAKSWFDRLQEAAPTQLSEDDALLAAKIAGWID
jgi:hypothetical protein